MTVQCLSMLLNSIIRLFNNNNFISQVFFGKKYAFIFLENNETKMWIVCLCPAFADFKYFI